MQIANLREQEVVLDRARGLTYQEIGERHGFTSQHAHRLVRAGTEVVNRLELELRKSRATGEQIDGYFVPHQDQRARAIALDYFQWCLDRLRERGLELTVERRGAPNGEVFFVTDVTDYQGGPGS